MILELDILNSSSLKKNDLKFKMSFEHLAAREFKRKISTMGRFLLSIRNFRWGGEWWQKNLNIIGAQILYAFSISKLSSTFDRLFR